MLSIPNPCNEDFDKMTPTDRGAFCGKCETDTFDFRNLSHTQIYEIMDEHKGKHVCGRFNKSQLDDFNSGFLAWKNQSPKTFQSKFLLACVLVFGFGLFSCEDEAAISEINTYQTEQVRNQLNPNIAQITNQIDPIDIDLLDYLIDPIQENSPEYPELIQCEIAGEISGDVIQTHDERNDYVLGGVMFYQPDLISTELIPLQVGDTSTILPTPIESDTRIFEAKAFPNPTLNNSTIALDIELEGQFEISMYNMSGQLIQKIYSGKLSEGRQQFEANLSGQGSGMYIIKIISQGQNETLKVQKVN